MRITWKAMPLLSTLAALVIIVHSAEEDLARDPDRDYRYELRPRSLDTGTPNDDQLWRAVEAVEAEPLISKSAPRDAWDDSPERPLKRRKPARKRKRRPYAISEEQFREDQEDRRSETIDTETPESIPYPQASEDTHIVQRYDETDEQFRYRDTKYNSEPTTEIPRRLRKRPAHRRNRWTEAYVDEERPIRRRVQKKKRPSEDRFTEFKEFRVDDQVPRLPDHIMFPEPDETYPKSNIFIPDHTSTVYPRKETTVDYMHLKEDKSLSEFSEEVGRREEIPDHNNPDWRHYGRQNVENQDIEVATTKYQVTDEDQTDQDFQNKQYEKITASEALKYLQNVRNTNPFDWPKTILRITSNKSTKHIRDRLESSKLSDKLNEKLNGNMNRKKKPKPQPKSGIIIPFFDVRNTISRTFTDMDENMDMGDGPINPATLKEILKRSKGTSLSETLQQYNISLSDLLRGKEDLTPKPTNEETAGNRAGSNSKENSEKPTQSLNQQESAEVFPEPKEVISVSDVIPYNTESVLIPETNTDKPSDLESQSAGTDTTQRNNEVKKNEPRISNKLRAVGIRRKLRMRPSINGTRKSQLNRDLMAQTARKYHNSRNITKSKEWKYVVPMMNTPNSSEESNNKNEVPDIISTTTAMTEETTTTQNTEYKNPSTIAISTQTENEEEMDNETTVSINTTQETTTQEVTTTTEKPKASRLRPHASRMGLRRQAFNNRLKRKRMKQKNSTTEPPAERNEYGVDFFGIPNLVSSSEFIAKTQTPKLAFTDIDEDFTTLDDFMTTEKSNHVESESKFIKSSNIIQDNNEPVLAATTTRFVSTTEETAKFEIEEILNDTRTSARLSRILMERNMTLNELVEHRERGSSHVHLADIFHNASKEPNPPEPFLSKSSIEPISKETYPLRAILEANLHDSAAKVTTTDTVPSQTYAGNIPVVMDFGNNVNENGENMGIMSLFNKFTNDISNIEGSSIGKDSEGTPYVTTVITINNTDTNDTTARESRVLKNEENNLKHDVVPWSELFELMRKNHQNETDELLALSKGVPSTNQIVLQDADGDGLIVLEDLQRLKDFDINTEGTLDIKSYEADAALPGILDRSPSHTRSVTVATASIVGLAMILFLLTYAAFKWKQQRNLLMKKQNFPDDRIPTPVFENRKGHKNNSSTRSISPMLATSNIYTLSTLDSNGKESPDYMWDSLRKPFQ